MMTMLARDEYLNFLNSLFESVHIRFRWMRLDALFIYNPQMFQHYYADHFPPQIKKEVYHSRLFLTLGVYTQLATRTVR